ncbi:DUF6153 family protein [Promicromonospora soli]
MHVITSLRALLAAPRQGVTGAVLIAVVIAGVVSMHSMSGSPGAHVPPSAVSAAHDVQHMTPAQAMPDQGMQAVEVASAPHGGVGAGDCSSGCGSHDAHDMTTAMCLMVLVVLLTLAAPPASFLDAVLLPFARRVLVAAPRTRPAAAPSLHALGILRT